jgi:hypothetical protein
MGDMHTGNVVGLTPINFCHLGPVEANQRIQKTIQLREEMAMVYKHILQDVGPVDFVIHNGDATDGMQGRAGSTDLISKDWSVQADWAVHNLKMIHGDPEYFLTAGTNYHCMDADGGDIEAQIASAVNGHFNDHLFLDVEGVNINAKHVIGASSIPHLRHSALPKERMFNEQWHAEGIQPLSDLYIRSHVHYAVGVKGYRAGREWNAHTLPALQNLGGKFGARMCGSTVHWGLVEIMIHDGEIIKWKPHIKILNAAKTLTKTLSLAS